MHALDWIVVLSYFGILFALAWWVILQSKDTADDYFLAGRNLGWFIVGSSIFASNIGSEHLVGLAGSGCTDGVAMAHYELHAWCLLVLAWILVPFYARSKVFTMPEFLERRFTPAARWVLSIISLVAYVVTKIAVGIFAGGMVFSVLLPEIHIDIGFMVLDSFWIGSFLVIILTGIYTIFGGLRAVAYTEALQTIVLVVGSLLVAVFGLIKLGGWGQLYEICGSEMFNLWKPLIPEGVEGTWAPVLETVNVLDDAGLVIEEKVVRQAWYFNGHYPWLGMLFCAPIIGLWYWCTDQYIVQRALGAPNETEARRGSIFASMLKLLPVFIFIIPGMICFALYRTNHLDALAIDKETGHARMVQLDPNTNEMVETKISREALRTMLANDDPRLKNVVTKNQQAFPLLVSEILPPGLRGLVVAGLLAALMSSLSGVFNASSTLFTIDFYSKFHPSASQHQLVWIGRVATGAMVVIGLFWVPVIQNAHGLYHYLQSVQGYLAPPIFVVFFLGVFIKRLNGPGCLAALIVGFLLGIFRLAIDTPVELIDGFDYESGSFLWVVHNIYFQYYSLLIFVICVVVMIVVSYMTKEPDYEKIRGLTYGTTSAEELQHSRSSYGRGEIIASVAVLIAILAAYLYFNG
ncbi:MAG: sodium:solute symporter [Pirellulaceae bacterium]